MPCKPASIIRNQSLVTQRNKRFCRCTTPNSECYLASIALDSPHRSRLVSSGEAAFLGTWFAALGSIAIFAHGGGYARLEAHRSHRCAHEQGRLRPWPHRIPTISQHLNHKQSASSAHLSFAKSACPT